VDYAYNALDKVTVEAKRLLEAFYGGAPRYSYMLGCSNGGRQALTIAQRMPLYYDGIVAGAPAMRFPDSPLGRCGTSKSSPHRTDGRPRPSDRLARLLGRGLAPRARRGDQALRCQGRPRRRDDQRLAWMRFRPRPAGLRAGKSDSCLAANQVEALRELYRGQWRPTGRTSTAVHVRHGHRLAGLARHQAGQFGNRRVQRRGRHTGAGQLRLYQLTPPATDYDPFGRHNLAEILRRVRFTAAMGDATARISRRSPLAGK
jgi:feruloyl esterase